MEKPFAYRRRPIDWKISRAPARQMESRRRGARPGTARGRRGDHRRDHRCREQERGQASRSPEERRPTSASGGSQNVAAARQHRRLHAHVIKILVVRDLEPVPRPTISARAATHNLRGCAGQRAGDGRTHPLLSPRKCASVDASCRTRRPALSPRSGRQGQRAGLASEQGHAHRHVSRDW
jgi:hypothetical protein